MNAAWPAEEQHLLDQARALIPTLADRAPTTRANRDVPPETLADFRRLGLLRIIQPRRFGGLQLRFSLFSRIVETLTEGCGSSGWVYAVLGEHQWLLASYPCKPRPTSGATTPLRSRHHPWPPARSPSAPPAAGAYRENSRSPAAVPTRPGPSSASSSAPQATPSGIAYLLVPFTDIEIIDDWHVLGLAGTGSRSLKLRDAFIPEHRCVLLSDLLAGTPPGAAVHPDYPLVRAPRGLLVNYSLPPVAIALGRKALAVALAGLRTRVSRGITRMAASEYIQITIAEAAATIDAASLTLWHGRRHAEQRVASGEPIPPELVHRTRRDMTHAQHQVKAAVEQLVEICGARSVYDADPLAQIRRDILTVLTHNVASRQAAMGAWGRWALQDDQPLSPS